MKIRHVVATVSAAVVLAPAVASAASIQCGDLSLGTREVTVDPALACTHAGLTNLGNPALVALLNSLITPDLSTLVERDDANSNGGQLSITGVGGHSGTWSFTSTLWDTYARMFLYFHFGDGPDTGGENDPDIFIVELAPKDASGTWSFGGGKLTGLSNVALLGAGTGGGGGGGGSGVPEPASLLLLGAGLAGLVMMRRRKQS